MEQNQILFIICGSELDFIIVLKSSNEQFSCLDFRFFRVTFVPFRSVLLVPEVFFSPNLLKCMSTEKHVNNQCRVSDVVLYVDQNVSQ